MPSAECNCFVDKQDITGIIKTLILSPQLDNTTAKSSFAVFVQHEDVQK